MDTIGNMLCNAQICSENREHKIGYLSVTFGYRGNATNHNISLFLAITDSPLGNTCMDNAARCNVGQYMVIKNTRTQPVRTFTRSHQI